MPKLSKSQKDKNAVRRSFRNDQAQKDWNARGSKDSAIGRIIEANADVENTKKGKK